MVKDIVSTSGEKPEKFIRELHGLTTHVKTMKLYAANPPLYGVNLGKNKTKFFTDNIQYVEYVQSVFCKENVVCNIKNKPYTKQQITKILYDNMDYIKIMNHVCSTYAVDHSLMEFILYNIDLGVDSSKFKSAVEKAFRFVKVTKENGIIMIRGLVGSRYQTVFCNQRMFADCHRLIELINNSDRFYMVNGQQMTLLGLMNLFNEFEPKNLTRYKGLNLVHIIEIWYVNIFELLGSAKAILPKWSRKTETNRWMSYGEIKA